MVKHCNANAVALSCIGGGLGGGVCLFVGVWLFGVIQSYFGERPNVDIPWRWAVPKFFMKNWMPKNNILQNTTPRTRCSVVAVIILVEIRIDFPKLKIGGKLKQS